MSSLLQHSGEIGRRGVRLEAIKVRVAPWIVGDLELTQHEDVDPKVPCHCGKAHPQLYTFWRKPVDMLGCWVRFRINGHLEAPDLSVPMSLCRLPRDARPLSADENGAAWHRP